MRDDVRLLLGEGSSVLFTEGDITSQDTDAIVNAANSSLMGGGGVDGAIHRAGGPAILQACKQVIAERGSLPAGKAVATTGGNMKAGYVIHTVGPIWRGSGNEEAKTLASCYRESLQTADQLHLHSLAFPSISTGAYGYPLHQAAEVAVGAVAESLPHCKRVREVRFVLFGAAAFDAYVQAAKDLAQSVEPPLRYTIQTTES